jgi:hypothetical protein
VLRVKSCLDACDDQGEVEGAGLACESSLQQSASAGSDQGPDTGAGIIEEQQQPEDPDDGEVQQQQQAAVDTKASADTRGFITQPDETAADVNGIADVQMTAAVHSQCTDVTEYTPVPVQHMDSLDSVR